MGSGEGSPGVERLHVDTSTEGGTLAVESSTFSSNSAANGGAIANAAGATLAVRNTTFSDNTTTSVGGGAIISSGTATIERSAILDNHAPINGGAINVQAGGTVTLTSSTIAGNTSGSLGGAMSNLGTLTVQASTIKDNTGSAGAAMATGNANVTFAADIIAAQTSGDACSPVNAAIVDGGYNLDTDGTCSSPSSPATGSHNGTTAYGSSTYGAVLDAYLADGLAGNGGPTQTFALLNSPSPSTTLANPAFDVVPPSFVLPVAVGAGSTVCSVSDQRGVVPAAGARCAIGAYLLQATKTALVTSAVVTQNASVTYTATVTPAPDGGTVSFDDGAGNPATTHCAAPECFEWHGDLHGLLPELRRCQADVGMEPEASGACTRSGPGASTPPATSSARTVGATCSSSASPFDRPRH